MEKINAAIVGFGKIGQFVLEALYEAPDFEIAGVVCHSVVDVPAKFKPYKFVTDINELGKVDVAILCVAPQEVTKYARKYLDMGINTINSFDIHTAVPALRPDLNTLTEECHSLLSRDIKDVIYRARGQQTKISNELYCSEIFSRNERSLKDRGYECKLDRDRKTFTIAVSAYCSITGKINLKFIKLGMCIRFDSMESSTASLQCETVDIPSSDIEMYLPVIDKMITEGVKLTEKYFSLRKKEKTAQLLEPLVIEHLEKLGVHNIDVSCSKDGVVRLHKAVGSYIVRVPVDFNNYKSQCAKWIKICNKIEFIKNELAGSDVQLLHTFNYNCEDVITGEYLD